MNAIFDVEEWKEELPVALKRLVSTEFKEYCRTNSVLKGCDREQLSAFRRWFCYGKPNVAIFNSFNFISSFVFCIQLCVQYSTCIQHSTRYSIFNFPFNIQLFILYSILHSPIQLSIQQFQLFIQHSTLIIKTFNYSFNIQLFIQHSTIRFN